MTIFIVARIDIQDRAGYAEYEKRFMEIFSPYDGALMAVSEDAEVLEGSWPVTRTVLISFPTRDAAMAWYQSKDYQEILQHRHGASHADIVLLNGLTA